MIDKFTKFHSAGVDFGGNFEVRFAAEVEARQRLSTHDVGGICGIGRAATRNVRKVGRRRRRRLETCGNEITEGLLKHETLIFVVARHKVRSYSAKFARYVCKQTFGYYIHYTFNVDIQITERQNVDKIAENEKNVAPSLK
jgi:hypothetical protein